MATGPAARAAPAEAWALWEPPPRVGPSRWMEREVTVPPEETAVPGRHRFTRRAFLREIVGPFVDPAIGIVAVTRPAQVGWTPASTAAATYFVRRDPSRIPVAMPTESVREIRSKDRSEPVVRASPAVASLIEPAELRDADNEILPKRFPGGALKLVGATWPAGLASWPAKRIMPDEVDRHPASAGDGGDPTSLVRKRARTYPRRGGKLLAGGTPDIEGLSLVEAPVGQGDERVWVVPRGHRDHGRRVDLFDRVRWDQPDGRHAPGTAAHHRERCGASGPTWSGSPTCRAACGCRPRRRRTSAATRSTGSVASSGAPRAGRSGAPATPHPRAPS